ncbi:hypothetical protein EYF80_016446 [Liparis tanakae]|uniref:Uncharacterized protein n=1 Tax=Liparis tanakae TaxID=230148 RepID=A0A4Z2I821_9TELE|nr:hypothetical protein EYF80_016446 [Liparis tanakae]
MPSVAGGGRAAPLMMSGRAHWRDGDERQSDHTFRSTRRASPKMMKIPRPAAFTKVMSENTDVHDVVTSIR